MGKKRMAILTAVILLILTACGQQETQSTPGGSETAGTTQTDAYWTENRWIHNGGTNGGITYTTMHPLYPSEEIRDLDAEYNGEYDSYSTDICTLGDIAYTLNCFYKKTETKGERSYYINRYDGTEEDIAHWPIELPRPEEYGAEEFFAASFDGKNEGELVLFLQGLGDGGSRTVCYLALHMTPEGETLSVTDLSPAMRELGVDLETAVSFEDAYVDGAGYYYLIPRGAGQSRGGDVQVLDPEGKSAGRMTPGEGYERAEWAMKLPDGSVVFSWTGQGESILLGTYDREKKALRTLMEERLAGAWLWTSTGGYLYYVNREGELIRCDIRTGSLEDCMYFPQLGLEENRRLTRIITGKDGEPEILGRRDGETVLCRLGPEASDTGALRLVSLSNSCEVLKNCVASFSQEHPDSPVLMECYEYIDKATEEANRERIMAELASGQGADMYYFYLTDMRILQEKGVLADLTELISEQTLDALWPGVRQKGTLDGQFVGIMEHTLAYTMIVSDELWPEDRWTLEEALDVMEAHPELQYPVMSFSRLSSEDVFSDLVMQNLSESPFLDLEEGRCDFTNPLFVRALKLAGTYTKTIDSDELRELYLDKNWVAMRIPIDMIYHYDLYKSTLGEDYHVVGYPAERGSGTYWAESWFLMVNRESEHKEQISAFLEHMLSYETQYEISNSVRRDMLENRMEEIEVNRGSGPEKITAFILYDRGLGGMGYWELAPGPKGDYRIEEYRQIMEKCEGISTDTSAIEDIIWEEVGGYFSGDREAEAVAEIIQNRVQLYLKEQW